MRTILLILGSVTLSLLVGCQLPPTRFELAEHTMQARAAEYASVARSLAVNVTGLETWQKDVERRWWTFLSTLDELERDCWREYLKEPTQDNADLLFAVLAPEGTTHLRALAEEGQRWESRRQALIQEATRVERIEGEYRAAHGAYAHEVDRRAAWQAVGKALTDFSRAMDAHMERQRLESRLQLLEIGR